MSNNYNDIFQIKIDVHIDTWSDIALRQMLVVRDVRFITPQNIYENQCSKISFWSTVARIRSFHVTTKPQLGNGYTWTNTPRSVHGLSFSLRGCHWMILYWSICMFMVYHCIYLLAVRGAVSIANSFITSYTVEKTVTWSAEPGSWVNQPPSQLPAHRSETLSSSSGMRNITS